MFCGKCGTEIQEKASFCPNCGNKIHTDITPVDKNKPHKGLKILLLIISVVLVIAIVLGILWLSNKDNKEIISNSDKSTTETSQESLNDKYIEYIDYFSNTVEWLGEYGFSDLSDFSYYKNGSFCTVPNEHLGILSAFECDSNNDANNNLITLSLLPNENNTLQIMIDMYSNANEIQKIDSLKVDADFEACEIPILKLGNTDLGKGSYFTLLAFIENNKLCIMHDIYASAEIGRSETYSNYYIYDITNTGLSLYKHFYCNEEEYKNGIRTCKIGETTGNIYTEINADYNASMDIATNTMKEWDSIKKREVAKMRSSVLEVGLDKYLATDDELERLDWISTTAIFEDGYFEKSSTTSKQILQLWFTNSENKNDYIADEIVDYTNIREKIS